MSRISPPIRLSRPAPSPSMRSEPSIRPWSPDDAVLVPLLPLPGATQ